MINIEYFNFLSILELMLAGLGITYNIYIIKSGKNKAGEAEYSRLLIYAGIINLVFMVLWLFIPRITYSGPIDLGNLSPQLRFYLFYQIATGLIFSIPGVITYGITFLLYGQKNQEQFRSFLTIAGIFWIIANLMRVAALNGNLFLILITLTDVSVLFAFIYGILYSIMGFLIVPATILLIVHGIKNFDSDLKIAGIFSLISYGTTFMFYLVIIPLFSF